MKRNFCLAPGESVLGGEIKQMTRTREETWKEEKVVVMVVVWCGYTD